MGSIISRKQAAGQIRKTLESIYMLSRSVPGEGATGEKNTPELERFFILCERLGENIQKKEYDAVLDSLDTESFRAFYHTVGNLAESYNLYNAKYFKENEPAGIIGDGCDTNGNLCHYAKNNPIKYINHNGRKNWLRQFLMDWFMNNSVPPTQQEIFNAAKQHAEQHFNYCMQNVQNKLSSGMKKAMNVAGDAIVACAEFMSDYGGVIAVACYASGNIGLGMIIDGVSIACDISLTAYKYNNGEISGTVAMTDIVSTIVITAAGMKCGSDFEKAAKRVLLEPKTMQIVSNCITDFASQGISTLNKINTEQ